MDGTCSGAVAGRAALAEEASSGGGDGAASVDAATGACAASGR